MEETSAATIFCEDIRHEANNQSTLVGVFNGGVRTQEGMGIRLALYTRVLFTTAQNIEKIEIFVVDPNGNQDKIGEAPKEALQQPADDKQQVTLLIIENRRNDWKFSVSGIYKVVVQIDDQSIMSGQLAVEIVKGEETENTG